MQGIADLDAVELEILNGLAPGEAMAAMQQMVAQATETGLAANREPNPAFREGPPPRLTTAAALAEAETATGDRPAVAARPTTPPDDFLARHVGAASGIRPGKNPGRQRNRLEANGDGGVRLRRGPKEIFSDPQPADAGERT